MQEWSEQGGREVDGVALIVRRDHPQFHQRQSGAGTNLGTAQPKQYPKPEQGLGCDNCLSGPIGFSEVGGEELDSGREEDDAGQVNRGCGGALAEICVGSGFSGHFPKSERLS